MKTLFKTLLVAALCQTTAAVAQSPTSCLTGTLASGVIAFYPFSGGSLNDMSGNGHNLFNTTLAHPTLDRNGNPDCAYTFDNASGDFLSAAPGTSAFLDNLTINPFSISLWYQPLGTRGERDYELLLGRGQAGTSSVHCQDTWGEWSIGLHDCRRPEVGFDRLSNWGNLTTPSCLSNITNTANHWHHLVIVYDRGIRSLYVDGVLTTALNGPCGSMATNVDDLVLGAAYTGDLDDIVIYNRALSNAEVSQLRTAAPCCGRTPPSSGNSCLPGMLSSGLIAFYPFGNGSLSDASTNGNHLMNPTAAFPTTDRDGNVGCAYHFSGTDYLQSQPGVSAAFDNITHNQFSLSIWYLPTTSSRAPGDYELLLGRGIPGTGHCPDTWGEWSAGLYDCRRAVVGLDENSIWDGTPLTGCPRTVTTWQHLVFTFDGINYNVYINGVLTGSSTSMPSGCYPGTSSPSGNVGDLIMGLYYVGDLDDIGIYNRALSTSEITALYQLPACCDNNGQRARGVGYTPAAKNLIRVFPNPTDGLLSVTAGGSVIRSVAIYSNSDGRLIRTYKGGTTNVSVNMESLAAGMYLIKVTTDTESSTQKVIRK